jgi:hypothetical protein
MRPLFDAAYSETWLRHTGHHAGILFITLFNWMSATPFSINKVYHTLFSRGVFHGMVSDTNDYAQSFPESPDTFFIR